MIKTKKCSEKQNCNGCNFYINSKSGCCALGFKVDAKTYLRQIKMADVFIDNKIAEKQKLGDLATKITSVTKSDPVSGSTGNENKIENVLIKVENKVNEILDVINEYIDIRAECILIIEEVKNFDALQYDILYNYYVLGKDLNEIAKEKGYTHQYIIETHKKAVNKVQEILNNL